MSTSSSCLPVEHKRDFDLTVVLDALTKCFSPSGVGCSFYVPDSDAESMYDGGCERGFDHMSRNSPNYGTVEADSGVNDHDPKLQTNASTASLAGSTYKPATADRELPVPNSASTITISNTSNIAFYCAESDSENQNETASRVSILDRQAETTTHNIQTNPSTVTLAGSARESLAGALHLQNNTSDCFGLANSTPTQVSLDSSQLKVSKTAMQINPSTISLAGSMYMTDQVSGITTLANDPDKLDGETSTICDLAKCDHNLNIQQYLTAFLELTRFFKLTGPVFVFVARDLSHKISIVQRHLDRDPENYSSLHSMIRHEQSVGTVGNKGSNASGTRTMLRLHWAFQFIIEFMHRLGNVTESTKTARLVLDVYHRTLANHHPWWTRQLATLAVHTLPTIKNLIEIMCKQDYPQVQQLLSNIVKTAGPILKYTDSLYEMHEITNIP